MDAAFFHLYLSAEPNGDLLRAEGDTTEDLTRLKASFPIPRDAVACITDTFPIVKCKDAEKWGDYRTKRIILGIYDPVSESIITEFHQFRFDLPPGPQRDLLPKRTPCQCKNPSRPHTQMRAPNGHWA